MTTTILSLILSLLGAPRCGGDGNPHHGCRRQPVWILPFTGAVYCDVDARRSPFFFMMVPYHPPKPPQPGVPAGPMILAPDHEIKHYPRR